MQRGIFTLVRQKERQRCLRLLVEWLYGITKPEEEEREEGKTEDEQKQQQSQYDCACEKISIYLRRCRQNTIGNVSDIKDILLKKKLNSTDPLSSSTSSSSSSSKEVPFWVSDMPANDALLLVITDQQTWTIDGSLTVRRVESADTLKNTCLQMDDSSNFSSSISTSDSTGSSSGSVSGSRKMPDKPIRKCTIMEGFLNDYIWKGTKRNEFLIEDVLVYSNKILHNQINMRKRMNFIAKIVSLYRELLGSSVYKGNRNKFVFDLRGKQYNPAHARNLHFLFFNKWIRLKLNSDRIALKNSNSGNNHHHYRHRTPSSIMMGGPDPNSIPKNCERTQTGDFIRLFCDDKPDKHPPNDCLGVMIRMNHHCPFSFERDFVMSSNDDGTAEEDSHGKNSDNEMYLECFNSSIVCWKYPQCFVGQILMNPKHWKRPRPIKMMISLRPNIYIRSCIPVMRDIILTDRSYALLHPELSHSESENRYALALVTFSKDDCLFEVRQLLTEDLQRQLFEQMYGQSPEEVPEYYRRIYLTSTVESAMKTMSGMAVSLGENQFKETLFQCCPDYQKLIYVLRKGMAPGASSSSSASSSAARSSHGARPPPSRMHRNNHHQQQQQHQSGGSAAAPSAASSTRSSHSSGQSSTVPKSGSSGVDYY